MTSPATHEPWVGTFVLAFFESLSVAGIAHCVLRNYEYFPLPRTATSDLDVLVSPERWRDARHILEETLAAQGLQVAAAYETLPGSPFIVFVIGATGPALHLDLYCGLRWHLWDLIDPKPLLARARDFTPPHPAGGHEAAALIISYLFHRCSIKHEYRERAQQLVREDRAGFLAILSPHLGPRFPAQLAECIGNGDWGGAATLARAKRRRLWLTEGVRHPLKSVGRLMATGFRLYKRLANPPGLFLVMLGPDGSGKSTLASMLPEALNSIYAEEKVLHLHWRPKVLASPKALLARRAKSTGEGAYIRASDDPHGKPPYGFVLSLARFLWFWADFLLGVPLRVWPLLWRNGLVIVDRYYYDFMIDQRRYRLDLPPSLIRFLARVVPKPDLTLVLDAPAAVLYARKQELTMEELERQRDALLRFAANSPSPCQVIDVSRPVADIIAELRSHLHNRLRDRYLK
jgi:thymidylate kinase